MNNLQKLFRSARNTHKILLPVAYGRVNNTQRVVSRTYCDFRESAKPKDAKAVISNADAATDEENQYEQGIKNKILVKALHFALESGFSLNSLTAAGQACGYPGVVHGLFPQGGADLIHYFNVKCNEELVEKMKTWQDKTPAEEDSSKAPAEFITEAVMTRLIMLEPYRRHWARALAMQALPNNVPNSLATLLSLVDDICHYSGDRSVDFNWYLRRVGLAGIYKASELYFLSDTSDEFVATRNFVQTRIKDAELIQSALNVSPVSAAPQALSAAFTTAKNMLGINPLKS